MYVVEGDLYEDGLSLKNGFFRTRHFARPESEGSLDLFGEERGMESGGEEGGREEDTSSQVEAHRRRDRLEREEFMKKCRVWNTYIRTSDTYVHRNNHNHSNVDLVVCGRRKRAVCWSLTRTARASLASSETLPHTQ